MSQEVLEKITFDNTAAGGSISNPYYSDEMTNVELPDQTDTVDVVEGYSVRRGARKELNARILKPSALGGLTPLMEENADIKTTMTWKDGTTTVLSSARGTVLPVGPVVPDNVKVWYDTDTSATDNPGNESSNTADSSWTELQPVVGETQATIEAVTRSEGRGLPYHIISRLVHDIPMFWDSTNYSTIKTEEDNSNEIRVAIENQAGEYLVYGDQSGGGVEVEIHENPSPQFDEVAHMVMRVYQTGALDKIITYPTNADRYFYGVDVALEAFGHDQADILTENR